MCFLLLKPLSLPLALRQQSAHSGGQRADHAAKRSLIRIVGSFVGTGAQAPNSNVISIDVGGIIHRCAAARTQPGSCGPAASGTGEKAGCEEKETRRDRRPSGDTAPHGLGSADARTGASACACACPRTFGPDGGGTIGDQLSLAVAVTSAQ